jgi:hypothetical protein
MKIIKGVITPGSKFNWKDYKYEVQLNEDGSNQVIKITTTRGTAVPDTIDIKTLEDLALANAALLDWCEREGWNIGRSGAAKASITKKMGKKRHRIFKPMGAGAPQTMTEPVHIGLFDRDSNSIGKILFFEGGINEWLSIEEDKAVSQGEEEKAD